MTKAEQNKQQKYTALLESAYHLFLSKGFDTTTVAEISKSAGVAKGTFYLYFKDKNQIRYQLIFDKLKELFQETISQIFDSGNDFSFEDEVIFFIDHIVDTICKDKRLVDFVYKNLTWPIIKKAVTGDGDPDRQNEMTVYLEELLEIENVRFRVFEIMIYLIVQTVSSVTINCLTYSDPVTIDKMKPHLYKTIKLIIKEYLIEEG